jgi:hypothetical protein
LADRTAVASGHVSTLVPIMRLVRSTNWMATASTTKNGRA